MTQLVINIEDKTMATHLKKILSAMEGVSIVKQSREKKRGLDEAIEDVKAGRVFHADSVDEMFSQILRNGKPKLTKASADCARFSVLKK